MGIDDANDAAGVPGECPGHDWHPELSGWHFKGRKLHREYRCVYCDAVLLLGPGEYVV